MLASRGGLDASRPEETRLMKQVGEDTSTQSSMAPIVLNVHCREFHTKLRVGAGEQSIKWLSVVVRNMYAKRFPEYHAEQFTPVLVCDKSRRPLFPMNVIREHLGPNDDVYVDLIGPDASINDTSKSRERSLWEMWAYNPPESFVNTTFFFDASGMKDLQGDTVGIFGNFNGWAVPIPMHCVHRPSIFAQSIQLPVGADVCFKFVLNDKHVVSENYPIVLDENNVQLNHVKVVPRPAALLAPSSTPSLIYQTYLKEETSRPTPGLPNIPSLQASVPSLFALNIEAPPVDPRSLAAQGAARGGGLGRLEPPALGSLNVSVPLRKLPVRVTGVFEGVKRLSEDMQRRLFESDWKKIRLADVVKTPHERTAIKDVLWRLSDALRHLFRFYASQTAGDVAFMPALTFFQVLHICGIFDRQIAEAHLEKILHRDPAMEEEDTNISSGKYSLGLGTGASSSSSSSSSLTGGLAASMTSSSSSSLNPHGNKPGGAASQALPAALDPFNPDHKLSRAEFCEALVRIALTTPSTPIPSSSSSSSTSSLSAVSSSSSSSSSTSSASSTAVSPAEAVMNVLTQNVLSRAVPQLSPAEKPDMRIRLLDPRVQRVLAMYASTIWSTFVRFATVTVTVVVVGPRDRRLHPLRTVALKEFETFLKEFQLCDQMHLPLRKAKSAFSLSVDLAATSSPVLSGGMLASASASGSNAVSAALGSLGGVGGVGSGLGGVGDGLLGGSAGATAGAGLSVGGAVGSLGSSEGDVSYVGFVEVLARLAEIKFVAAKNGELHEQLSTLLEFLFPNVENTNSSSS